MCANNSMSLDQKSSQSLALDRVGAGNFSMLLLLRVYGGQEAEL